MLRLVYSKLRFSLPHAINKLCIRLRHGNIGKNFVSYGRIFIRGRGQVSIGDNVKITSCLEGNPIGGATKMILFAKEGSRISIGNNTGISNSAIIAAKEIAIGNNVMIGNNCKLYDNDFHSLVFEERMQWPDPGIKSAPIRIEDGAFIGASTIVLKGVTIGQKSIIGAGSVVTKSVPAGEIWAGNPARFVRKV